MDYTIREGNYEKLGVQKKDDAVIFTFEGEKEENCSILFYGKKAEPVCKILVPEEYCRGSVRSVAVTGKLWKNLNIICNIVLLLIRVVYNLLLIVFANLHPADLTADCFR